MEKLFSIAFRITASSAAWSNTGSGAASGSGSGAGAHAGSNIETRQTTPAKKNNCLIRPFLSAGQIRFSGMSLLGERRVFYSPKSIFSIGEAAQARSQIRTNLWPSSLLSWEKLTPAYLWHRPFLSTYGGITYSNCQKTKADSEIAEV